MSTTTTQTIIQVQIAGCMSHCQNVSQVQEAAQSNSTVQAIGVAAQLANALETPAPSSTPQTTSTITHLQLGCLSACFGTTTSDPSTAALTQLLLSQLSSLQPPSGSGDLQPVPANLQNVVQQAVCQVQESSGVGVQAQAASQTTAVVQVTPSLPADLGTTQPAGTIVDQTQQQIWQLQVGCLFYCVDTQQVQEAQQSTVVVVTVGGPSASGTTAVVVSQQTIWQLQVGCLAWCWDSTQLQQAGSETTIAVGTASAPGDAPQAQPPSPKPPTEAVAAPPPASGSPEPGPPPSLGSPPGTQAYAAIRLLSPMRGTGLAIVGVRFVASAVAPASAVWPASRPAPAGGPLEVSRSTTAQAAAAGISILAAAHARSHGGRAPRPRSGSHPPAAIAGQRALSAASGGSSLPLIAVLLAVAAIVSIALFRSTER